jgi:hypothetical protein
LGFNEEEEDEADNAKGLIINTRKKWAEMGPMKCVGLVDLLKQVTTAWFM